jgi:periplasmic protein TonB
MKSTVEMREAEARQAGAATSPAKGVLPRLEIVVKPAPAEHVMFSDSLLEFGPQRKRRFFATTTSFVVNALLLTFILALPLMFTEELPKAQLLTFLVAPPPPPPPPPPAAAEQMQRMARLVETNVLSTGGLRTPSRIPSRVQMIKEDDAPPPMASTGGVIGGVPGGVPGGQLGGVIGGIVSATSNLSSALIPKLAPVAPQRIRVSQGITKGLLIHRVEPPYPMLAREARVQGEVVLRAVISPGGEIQNLEVISGHPMLVPAAIAAVKEWRYKPYLLNGQPVEVETTITVIFNLTS